MLNQYHVTLFTYFLEKLKATPDGDGTLLDHSLVLYGSGMSDGNSHNHTDLPVVLAGGASGRLKGGRHIQNPKDTPMANLLLSMLDSPAGADRQVRRQLRPRRAVGAAVRRPDHVESARADDDLQPTVRR